MLSLKLVSLLLATPGLAHADPAALRTSPPPGVLQVPYVAQSELLCGGAAIAMIERWWGRRGVYAEEFASLVRPAAGGILTTELVRATAARGWQALAVIATPVMVQQSLRDSVPVVALIQVAANRYHYVVIVGWSAGQVVFHDPAVAPYVSLKESEFVKRWHGADQWAMLVRPATTANPEPVNLPTTAGVDSLPCRPWLDQAADAAGTNHLADARVGHAFACPTLAIPIPRSLPRPGRAAVPG